MVTRGRSRSAPRRRATKRIYSWFNIQSTVSLLAVGGTTLFDLTPLSGLPPQYEGGFTVLRLIGNLSVRPAVSAQNIVWTHGILATTRQALALGAIPNPVTDLVDWYMHHGAYVESDAGGVAAVQFPFDIRTARKIRGEDRTLASTFHNSVGSGGFVETSLYVRLLLTPS